MKKNVLVVSPGLPYPPVDGHKLKLYNLIRQLSAHSHVHLVIISNEKVSKEVFAFLQGACKTFSIFKQPRFLSLLKAFCAIFRKSMPLQVAYYSSNKVKKHIIQRESNYDYIILNLIRTAAYGRLLPKHKVILDIVDSIGINYLRSRKKTSSFFFKYLYSIEARRLLRYEKEVVENALCTLFVNKDEALYYSKFGKVKWLPNGVNSDLLNKHIDIRKNHICFFGAMFYQPNIDAVKWFVENVLPMLHPEITFYIVGINPSRSVRNLESDRVKVTGFLDNPYELLQSGLCTVAPMQTGGGIQNKILESMALGQLTITNQLGARPIVGTWPTKHLLVANTPDEFSTMINSIYNNPTAFEYIRTNARSFVLEHFSWQSYGNSLKSIIN